MSSRRVQAATIALGLLVTASCGGSSGEPDVLAAQSEGTADQAGSAGTASSIGGGLHAEANAGTTTSQARQTTTTADGLRSRVNGPADETTSSSAGSEDEQPDISLPEGAEDFADPEGDWLMSIGGDWAPSHGIVDEGVELWFLPGSSTDFADNVTVLTQQNLFSADLESYLDLSVGSGTAVLTDFELINDRLLVGPYGQKQGILEYSGTVEGFEVHFFQVVVLNDDIAIVATLAATQERFAERLAETEQYLRTLRFG